MRNLELFKVSRNNRSVNYKESYKICLDNLRTYILKDSSLIIYKDDEILQELNLDCETQCITKFEILEIENKLWFGTGTCFVCLNLSDYTVQIIEHGYEFTAASWNPSQDSIVIISCTGEVEVFSVDFEYGCLTLLQGSHLENVLIENEFIAVGWGAAETQFKGSMKKAILEEEESVEIDDDFKPRISWRGNGDMFVVNYYSEGKRRFKVFQYPCELVYQSSNITGLLPVIAWRPEGNFIACAAWTNKGCKVALYEKNGMFRHSFELANNAYVNDLKWNLTGDILAVHQSNKNGFPTIDLYTTKNYIWYLKQRLNFTNTNPLIHFDFLNSPSLMTVLQIITVFDTITYSFKFETHHNPKNSDDSLTCAVINGNKLLLTHCKDGITPPPLYNGRVIINSPINFVIFSKKLSKFAVIDCNNLLTVFAYEGNKITEEREFDFNLNFECKIPLKFHHFVWCNNDSIKCLGLENNCCKSFILNMNNENWQFYVESDTLPEISYMNEIYDGSLVQQVGNRLLLNTDSDKILASLPIFGLYIKWIEVEQSLYILALTATNRFFINETEIFPDVISFIIYDEYLFLTNTQSKITYMHITKQNIDAVCESGPKNKFLVRPVEQSSFLLFAIPNSSMIVMQAPRGNIEIYTCPLITSKKLELLLEKESWDDALDVVRIEKLNVRILLDLNTKRFLENIHTFIEKVKNPLVINEFLLGLEDENEFKETICNKMIEYMEKNNHHYYISSIIVACLVKNSPTSVKESLEQIQHLLYNMKDSPSIVEVAEEALKCLHTLQPTDDIFDTALSMYDLNLALFVARSTNMDPKVYEPFILNLKKLDEIRLRFEILDYLKQFSKAIKYLLRCSKDEDEIIMYIEKHKVFRDAFKTLQPENILYKPVVTLYAHNLQNNSLHEEAAVLFHSVELYNEALDNYKKALQWRQSITLLKFMALPETKYRQHLKDIQNYLLKAGKISEAAEICGAYLLNYQDAVTILISNKCYVEALQFSQKYNCFYNSGVNFINVIEEHCQSLKTKFQSMEETFTKYKTRLNVVRREKKMKCNQLNEEEQLTYGIPPHGLEDEDIKTATLSIISFSTKTSGTRASTMSSRNRRKEERKMQNLREGNVYEDIALTRALHDLIRETFELGPHIRDLFFPLFSLTGEIMPTLKIIHNILLRLQISMLESIKMIWPPNLNSILPSDPEAAVYDNLHLLDVKYRVPPTSLTTSWRIHNLTDSNVERLLS